MPGGENGTIMKKSDVNERNALHQLLDDPLRNFVPEFKREVEHEGHGRSFYIVGVDSVICGENNSCTALVLLHFLLWG